MIVIIFSPLLLKGEQEEISLICNKEYLGWILEKNI